MKTLRWLTAVLIWSVCAAPATGGDTDLPTRLPPVPHIVAVGDVHGDVEATRTALQLAGVINDQDQWIGGNRVVVQTGDLLDRGDNERVILDLFTRLSEEAARSGGAFFVLNGNHEVMNVALDFRYVTEGGYADFRDFADGIAMDSLLAAYPAEERGRVAAFRPGGPYARLLARSNTILIIGDNLFVHGSVTPESMEYGIERLNADVRAWMKGEGPCPEIIHEKQGPVWSRLFSYEADDDDCEVLDAVLDRLGIKRMIVGHTVQEEGINSYCRRKVWCIDAGMSAHYGGKPQVLEIRGDSIRVLSEN